MCNLLLAGMLVLACGSSNAQDERAAAPAAAPESRNDRPIKLNQIPARLESTAMEVRRIAAAAVDQNKLLRLAAQVESATVMVNSRLDDPRLADLSQLSARSLGDLLLAWRSLLRELQLVEGTLSRTLADATKAVERLRELREPWRKTVETAEEDSIPESIQTSIRSLLADIEVRKTLVLEYAEQLASLRAAISSQIILAHDNIQSVEAGERDHRARLFSIDAPPVWQLDQWLRVPDGNTLSVEIIDGWRIQLETLKDQRRIYAGGTEWWLFILLAAFVALKVAGRRQLVEGAQPERTRILATLLSHPLATAFVLATAAAVVLFPAPLVIVRDLMRLMLVPALIVLLRPYVHRSLHRPLLGLVMLFVLDNAKLLVGGQALVDRVFLLVSCALAIATLLWLLRSDTPLKTLAQTKTTWRIGLLATRLSAVLLGSSLLLNLLGALALAALLAEGVSRLAFSAVAVFALNLVLRGITEAALQSRLFNASLGIRHHHDLIRSRTDKVYNFACGLLLITLALYSFRIEDPVGSALRTIFTESVTVGTLELSMSSTVTFVIALWIGVQLSRFIRFILEEDVYPRVRLPRGVPGALTMLVRYGVITLAFLFALAAAGIEVGNFAIIAGALGVGIGFGLQNVVNNFISGLILAFERPIQTGDVIQFGTEWGKVIGIGIRSSRVRTFDGAEIIVPNGDLISHQLINWTLSDRQRRMEILVGVAYGTNPHQVIDILTQAAAGQLSILQEPPPMATFTGFGDSSLNFSLRAWTADFDNFVAAKSALTLAVHDALQAAGIVIPFPQRDLHLRSAAAPL